MDFKKMKPNERLEYVLHFQSEGLNYKEIAFVESKVFLLSSVPFFPNWINSNGVKEEKIAEKAKLPVNENRKELGILTQF